MYKYKKELNKHTTSTFYRFVACVRAGRRLVKKKVTRLLLLFSKNPTQKKKFFFVSQSEKKNVSVSRVFFFLLLVLTEDDRNTDTTTGKKKDWKKKMLSQQQPFSIGLRHNIWSNPVWRVKKKTYSFQLRIKVGNYLKIKVSGNPLLECCALEKCVEGQHISLLPSLWFYFSFFFFLPTISRKKRL